MIEKLLDVDSTSHESSSDKIEEQIPLNGEQEYIVNTIEELLTILSKVYNSNEKVLWFRGQSGYSWDLSPGFFRKQSSISEATLLMKFKQSASQLISGTPNKSYDWMFLMQHYGLPTRLLDWSESPLVALYFAVENISHHSEDGALWLINPIKLNILSRIKSGKEDYFIPSFEDEIVNSYTLESIKGGNQNLDLLPVAILAARNNPRIQAQLGVFTIHHRASEKIENAGKNKDYFMKIRIPNAAKASLKKQLSILGYSRFQIFPELASIADVIKENML